MIDWHAIAPELVVTATLVAVLLVDLVLPNRAKWTLAAVAGFGLLLAVIPLVTLAFDGADRLTFAGSYQIDDFSLVLKGLFIGAGYVALLLSVDTIEEGAYYRGEFYFLLLASILGMFLVASARDLLVLFIAFELFSTPGYLLAAWKNRDLRSNESGMKYFILGVLSTAIMLYGMSLLYGVAGSTKFSTVSAKLGEILADGAPARLADVAPIAVLGIVLVLVGFAFKVSAVPFHFWAPDTYEGAPTPVTAFFSVSVKAAGFVGLIVLCYVGLRGGAEVWRPMIYALAVLTMTVGNLIALRQTNIVRMLAYSSIAQSGYVLAPFTVVGLSAESSAQALQAAVLYLLVYAVMNLGAFGVVIAVARRTRSGTLSSLDGLFRVMPSLAVVMTMFLASLAGIPPLAGWLGKFQVFSALASEGSTASWVLAGIVVVNSVIAAFYYMAVVRRMFFEEPSEEILSASESAAGASIGGTTPALTLALGITSVLVVIAGITPILTYLAERAVIFIPST